MDTQLQIKYKKTFLRELSEMGKILTQLDIQKDKLPRDIRKLIERAQIRHSNIIRAVVREGILEVEK